MMDDIFIKVFIMLMILTAVGIACLTAGIGFSV